MSPRIRRLLEERPQLPFILPLVVFGSFLALENYWPEAKGWLYPAKTLATGICLWLLRREFKGLAWRWSWLGIVIGVVVVVQWVGMEETFKAYWRYPPLPLVGAEVIWDEDTPSDRSNEVELPGPQGQDEDSKIFNPEKAFGGRNLRFWIWIAIRMIGAVIVVPIMEELFWRGFLLRFFESRFRYFEKIPLGEFGWYPCLAVAVLFALVHPWYISAFVCALLYNWLMYKTRSILACIVAHALTNLLLWVYILYFNAWWLS